MARASDMVRQAIENEIESGLLEPGNRIDESALAQRFSISRTPAREAILQLAASGHVKLVPRQGAVIASLSPQLAADMVEVLIMLEAEAAKLAARRMTSTERDKLQRSHNESSRFVEGRDSNGYQRSNAEFHQIIYEGCQNAYLADQLRRIRARINRYNRSSLRLPARIVASYAEHKRILDAILDGDADVAQIAMRDHIGKGGTALTDLVAAATRVRKAMSDQEMT